ncbi:MAG: hypothetical protein JZU63_00550 [Rhodoferax sp.]|nr:hypothetical protein [Rhodoferax sp.]
MERSEWKRYIDKLEFEGIQGFRALALRNIFGLSSLNRTCAASVASDFPTTC